jgi:hypothetical protein
LDSDVDLPGAGCDSGTEGVWEKFEGVWEIFEGVWEIFEEVWEKLEGSCK